MGGEKSEREGGLGWGARPAVRPARPAGPPGRPAYVDHPLQLAVADFLALGQLLLNE